MGKWRCCECKGDYVLEKSDHVLGVTSVAGAVLASSGARLRLGHYVLKFYCYWTPRELKDSEHLLALTCGPMMRIV